MTDGQLLILILLGLAIYVWMLSHLPPIDVSFTDADLYVEEQVTSTVEVPCDPAHVQDLMVEYDESGNVSKVTVFEDYRKAAR